MIHAYAATEVGGELKPFEYDPGELAHDGVEIEISHCGVCHSDLSMLENQWGFSSFPMVPGHEVIGTVSALGEHVTHLSVGQRVGLGWFSGSCMSCHQCMSGSHNLCSNSESTIVGRYGGFADRVRTHWSWAVPLPETLDPTKAGPLFCGGITVFGPMLEYGVKPTDRVGVVGIGGLGHMALQFLNKWGCEVFAFSSNPDKADEAKAFGAHKVVNSRDPKSFQELNGALDFLLVTANVDLDWGAYLSTLAPKGRLHFVGAVPSPLSVHVHQMLSKQTQISSSPLGSPAQLSLMLEFCARHGILPQTETFGLSEVNDAMAHLKAGKARYRIVLDVSR
ncbi:MAG: NAD(P)-dependent alcohol dehydrogenase [Myxococcales bacterium]|nr:NAD(P)-dependent alcohol dehydrogenase [Myxococcales bacterium]